MYREGHMLHKDLNISSGMKDIRKGDGSLVNPNTFDVDKMDDRELETAVNESMTGVVNMDDVRESPDDPNFDYRDNTFVKPEIDLEEYFATEFASGDFKKLLEYFREHTKIPEEVEKAFDVLSENVNDLPLVVNDLSGSFSEISVDVTTKMITKPEIFFKALKQSIEDNYSGLTSLSKPARQAFWNYVDPLHAKHAKYDEEQEVFNENQDDSIGVDSQESLSEFKLKIANQSVAVSEAFGLVVAYLTTEYMKMKGYGGVVEESLTMAVGNYFTCVVSFLGSYLKKSRERKDYKFSDALKDAFKIELASTPWGFVQYGFQAVVIAFAKSVGLDDYSSGMAIVFGGSMYMGIMGMVGGEAAGSSLDKKNLNDEESDLVSVGA